MGRREELVRALTRVFGAVPSNWEHRLPDMERVLTTLPPVDPDRPMPFVTYLLFAVKALNLTAMSYVDNVIGEKTLQSFKEECQGMRETAAVMAVVDAKNFEAEVKAFNDIPTAITNPHLDISPLYRYMAAIQQDYIFLLTPEFQNAAKLVILYNPYMYNAYGDEFVSLMPMAWEEVYYG